MRLKRVQFLESDPIVARETFPPARRPAPRGEAPSPARAQGLALFRKMRRIELTQPMRTADDPDLKKFQGYLESMRDLDAEQPVPCPKSHVPVLWC